MRKIFNYLANLTKSKTEESSKRFLALYVVLVIVSILTYKYTTSGNFTLVLAQVLGFAGLLLGIGSWQNVQDKKNKGKDEGKNE